ncbi:MAG TPA: Ig-like domain-containing protein [Thermoanaerobaculia bacterium]|nr:Ig-like domain-containing protein [Thermoanaerobaculia bacterium]
MTRIGIALSLTLLLCAGAFAQQAEVTYNDDFQSYGSPRNPAGWVDNSIGKSTPIANGLYKTWPDPLQGNQGSNIVYGTKQSSGKPEGNNPRIGTFSTLTTKSFRSFGRFEYRGRFIRTSADTRIGFTFHSSYPEKDSYYLVGLWTQPATTKLTMQLFGFGAGTIAKDTDSEFTPEINKWYRFLVQVDDVDGATNIRARFWLDGTEEPKTFTIDATDASATRLKEGRIGIWSAVKGDAYVDDLFAKSPVDHTPPVIAFFEGGVQLQPGTITPIDHDARVDIRATDDLSGLASLTATAGGQPYTPLAPIAAEGPHTIHAIAKDNVGNTSESSVQVLVDKSPPVITLTESGTPLPLPFSTFRRIPAIDIKAADTWTKVEKITATMDGKSDLVITEQGTHYLVVEAIDTVGNKSVVQATILVDFTAPVISFYDGTTKLDPRELQKFQRDVAIDIKVTDAVSTATYTATILTGSNVASYTAGTLIANENEHTIVVKAVDEAGNTAESTLTILVDKTAPIVAVLESDEPFAGGKFKRSLTPVVRIQDLTETITSATLNDKPWSSGQEISSEDHYTLKVTVTDELNWVTVVPPISFTIDKTAPVVAVTEGGQPLVTGSAFNRNVKPEITIADITNTTTTALLNEQPYTFGTELSEEAKYSLTATVVDELEWSTTIPAIVFFIDKTAPVVTLMEGDSELTDGQWFNRDVTPRAIVKDTTETTTTATLTLADGTVQPYELGTPVTAEGVYTLKVRVTDKVGLSTDVPPVTFTIDKTPPAIAFTHPIGGSTITTARVIVTGEADDAVSVEVNGIEATITDKKFATPVAIELLEGENTIVALGIDRAGNNTTTAIPVTLDTRAPELSVTAPAQNACLNVTEIAVSGRASDAALSKVKVTMGTTSVDATIAADRRSFTATIPAPVEGKFTIRVEAIDASGHTAVAAIAVVVDRTKPVIAVTESGVPFTASAINRPVSLDVRATNETNATLTVTLDGQPYTPGTVIASETPAPHVLRATAKDCAGLVSDEKVVQFIVDRTVPAITSINPANGATVGEKPSSITGTLSEPAAVVLEATGAAAQVSGVAFTLAAPLQEGLNTFVLVIVDAAGNSSRFVYTVTIHTTAPSVEIVENGLPLPANHVYRRAVTPIIRSDDAKATITATLNNAPFTSGTEITSDGDYTITAKARDSFGHESATATVSFTIDRTGPAVDIASPAQDAVINAESVEVRGTTNASSVAVNTIAAAIANGAFTATVPLELGPNTLIAVAVDAAGNGASDAVDVTRDTGKIGILLAAPPDKLLTNRPTTLVAGQVLTPANARSVTINSTQVSLDPAGMFRVNGFALSEGPNTITASVNASSGEVNSISVTVTADFTPPVLKVLANSADLGDGARFATSPSITLDATDENPAGLTTKLTIDGELVSPGVTTLLDGGHALTAIARDAAGNETRVDRVFFIGTAGSFGGCALSAFDPIDGAAVFTETVRIAGRSGGAIGVQINDSAASVADGSFCGDATLVPGRNEVTIRCTDAAGQPTDDPASKLILYRYIDPTIAIASPAAGSTVTATSITVTGTVGAGVVSGDVNGIFFTVPDDGAETHTFSVPNVPIRTGLNVITARAKTKSSRIGVATTRVHALNSTPQIAITSPLASTDTGATSIDVSGTYTDIDPSTITVKLGTTQYAALSTQHSDTTGTFTATVPLAAAQVNVIEATGRNGAGAQASSTVDVTHIAGGPSVSIDAPRDNTYFPSTQSTTLRVTGTFTGDAGTTVSVNGVVATITGSTFAADVELSSAAISQLIARATAPDARNASDSVRVVRFTDALAVRESFPANDATSIDRGAAIVVLFNHPLDRSTAASAFRMTDADGATVDCALFVERDAISFAPAQPLRSGVRYTITLGSSLKDVAGSSLAAAHSFAFTTGGSAPANAPIVDDTNTTGCFSGTTLTGRVSIPGAQVQIEVDGVKMRVLSDAGTGAFKATFAFSGQTGYHIVRVAEVGADGSLSAERALCFRINCTVPNVLAASLDRTAKTVTIQFSKPMDLTTLVAASDGTIVLVPEGESALTGTVALNATGDTATITLASVPAKHLALTVKKSVKDAGGASMVADYTQTFQFSDDPALERGKGYVSGAVYDATNGRPLAGARVFLNPQSSILNSNPKGRYTLALPEGAYTIEASAPGYTTVWRQVVVPAGAGVVPIDIRLTRRGTALTHGGDTKITKPVELTLASTADVRVTSIGGQSLAGLLPLGWSPLASAEVSGTSEAIPGAKLTFHIDASAVTAAAQTLALVQYDSEADEWRVLVPIVNVGSDGRVVVDISETGNYALVYADKGSTLVARAGASLTGIANPCVTTPDVCRLTGKSFVLDPKAVLPSGRTVATLTTDGTKPYPSGTAVQAFIDEQLNLADGRVLVDPPFATDLLIYRNLAGTDGIADFHLSPTLQAQSVILRDGVDHIRIVDYPGRIDRGTLLGAEGGRVPGDGSVLLDVPAGATAEPLHASVSSMSDADLAALGAIPGFRIAAGFTFTLTRANQPTPIEGVEIAPPSLFAPAKATVSIPSSILNPQSSIPQIVIAEILSSTQHGILFRLVALTSPSVANVFVSRPIVSTQLPLDGIVRDGRYLVLVADNPIASAYGQVKTGAAAIANARVTSGIGSPMTSPLGVRDLTRLDGVFVVPVAAKPATPFSLVARSLATGDGAAAVHATSPDPDTFINFGALTLAAQAPQLTGLTPADNADVDVTQPLVVQATFNAAIDAASLVNGLRVTNLTTNTALAGTITLNGSSTVRFMANEPLRAASRYSITVAPTIRTTTGTPFGRTVTTQFSTRAIPPGNTAIHPELVRITIPDESGKSIISGKPGALPNGAQALAVRRGRFFIVSYSATVSSDGSFSFDAGHLDPRDRIFTSDAIDLQVLDPVSRAIVAIIELTPFVTADGKGFLAPANRTTTFSSGDGMVVTVPAGAFDEAARIDVHLSTKGVLAAVPRLDTELNWSAGVQLDFTGVAKQRLQLDIPAPPGTDPVRPYLLALLGQSMRGPRLMIVDTLRVEGGRFTSSAAPAAQGARLQTNAALTGADVKNYLLGVNRSGIYAVVDIKSNFGWSVMEGLHAGYDLFWDTYESLYAADFYLAEGRGRVAIPVLAGTRFKVTGVDTGLGVDVFNSTYEPIAAGAVASLPSPQTDIEGPYPIYASPFRVEIVDVGDDSLEVRDFTITVAGGQIKAATTLPVDVGISMLNVSKGRYDASRTSGLAVEGAVGDRVVLFVAERDVDPNARLSVVFNEPIDTSGDLSSRVKLKKGDVDITSSATLRADSGGRRINIDLTSTLERGATYTLELHPTIADTSEAALRIGQVSGESVLSEPIRLELRVRAPADVLTSFDLESGAIRDMAQSDNVLLLAALDGGLVAYDIANPAAMTPATRPMAVALGDVTSYWAVAADHHGRVYASGLTNLFGVVRSYRIEDFRTTSPTRTVTEQRGAVTVSWAPGATTALSLPSGTVLSDRAEATPRKIQIAVQDTDLTFSSRAEFAQQMASSITSETTRADDLHQFALAIPVTNGYPYRVQRITIENRRLGMRWSADAIKAGPGPAQPALFNEVVAAQNDQLRILYNERTWVNVSLFGYGIGVYDLNAVESNDEPTRPAGYVPIREQIRLTKGELRSECPTHPTADSGAIQDLTFSPEAALVGGEALKVVALETRRGALDLTIDIAGGDANACSERAPTGLLFRSSSASGPIDHPRLGGANGLREKFRALTGRYPNGRFNAIARYDWNLSATDNTAGARGSEARTAVERNYLLVAGNEYGLLVVEAGGTPPSAYPAYLPLGNEHLADIIWIPGGAFGVRTVSGSHYATVVDGEGRVLLVDLQRLDERWGIPSDQLFKTASESLSGAGTYGAGKDDPRIVWKSRAGVVNSTMAPILDGETGYLFAGRLLEKTTKVASALDPRVVTTDGEGRITKGAAPSGILGGGGALAVFRIEMTLPGAMTESIGGELKLAIESERVVGAITEETPDGYPRAHLRNVTMRRMVPTDLPSSRWQRGYNRFLSDPIVTIADPRASMEWSGSRGECFSCDPPTNAPAAQEIYSLGRFFHVRPEVNLLTGSPYAYLGEGRRLETRLPTIMADTVRDPKVRVAAQHPPVADGMLQETTYLHSGEIETSAVDLDAGGRAGWNVLIDRTYRSRTIGLTAFGGGWDSSMLKRLRQLPTADVEYRDGSEVWLFKTNNDGTYTSPAGLFLRLKKTDRGWTLTDQQLRATTFDELGRVSTEADEFYNPLVPGSGNFIRYIYGADGRLAKKIDPVGRETTFTWNATTGLLEGVTDWRGRNVSYVYANGLLKDAQLPNVPNTQSARPTTRYTYSAAPAEFSAQIETATNLETITDPKDVATGGPARVKFGYTADQVTSQQWGSGETASFTYSSPTETRVTDVLGQQRKYTLVTLPNDRTEVSEVSEIGVPVITTPFGTLPATLTAGPPPTTVTDRVRTLTRNAGVVTATKLVGVREEQTSFAAPAGAPGLVPTSSTTTALAGGAQPIARTFTYQPNGPTFLQSVTANGKTIVAPEAHRYNTAPVSTNSNVTSTETFDASGQLIKVTTAGGTDPQTTAGSQTEIEYFDANAPLHKRGMPKRITKVAAPNNLITTFDYPTEDREVKVDPYGVVTTTDLDAWRRAVRVRVEKSGDPLVVEQQLFYDATGRLERMIEKKGAQDITTSYRFDVVGRRIETRRDGVAVPGGQVVTTTSYDIPNRRIITTDPGGAVTTTDLDLLGRSKRTHVETGAGSSDIETHLGYDLDDNVVFTSDGFTASATAFDAHGRAIATMYSDGTVTTTDYDEWGRARSVKDLSADPTPQVVGESSYDFTDAGTLKTVKTKVDSLTERRTDFAWDGGGRTTTTATSGRAAKSEFDPAGRLVDHAVGAGSVGALTDIFTRTQATAHVGMLPVLTTTTERSGPALTAETDHNTTGDAVRNRLGNLEWREQFDQLGSRTEAQSPGRPATQYETDSRGAVKKEILPDGSDNEFTYDAGGGETRYEDPANEPTSTERDLIRRPLLRTYADGTTERFEWEGPRIKSLTDRQGRKQVFAYNAKGQLAEIGDALGDVLDRITYDSAGRIVSWLNKDAEVTWSDFDLDGNPKKTTQKRFKDGTGLTSSAVVLDEYVQQHQWNEHGERTHWSMPAYAGLVFGPGWSKWIREQHDAMGNLILLGKVGDPSAPSAVALMTGSYRNAGRPDARTVFAGVSATTPGVPIVRTYGYHPTTSLMNELVVTANGLVIAGSEVTHDGLHKSDAKLLGISGGDRYTSWRHDTRGRLSASLFGAVDPNADPSAPIPGRAREELTPADFRTAQERVQQLTSGGTAAPGDPPTKTIGERAGGGHKIDRVTRGPNVYPFGYGGAEVVDDGRFVYTFDAKGRLIVSTEKATGAPKRRVVFSYSGTGRLVGRRAEYTAVADPSSTDWLLEDRASVIKADGIAPEVTFVWDAISDRLITLAKAGAVASDPHGGILKQVIHGGMSYDDPIETATVDPLAPNTVNYLYPIYDEAGAGSLQTVVNKRGEIVGRNLSNDPFGGEDLDLAGAAIDRVAVKATKNSDGTLNSVEVTMRSTEAIAPASLPSGVRLAAVDANGAVIRTSSAAPSLADANTARWTLSSSEYATLTTGAAAISIAVTNELRASAWGADVPVLPAPQWAASTKPLYSSPQLPIEVRESLSSLLSFLSGIPGGEERTTKLYEVEGLALLGATGTDTPLDDILSARLHAHPYAEPLTGLKLRPRTLVSAAERLMALTRSEGLRRLKQSLLVRRIESRRPPRSHGHGRLLDRAQPGDPRGAASARRVRVRTTLGVADRAEGAARQEARRQSERSQEAGNHRASLPEARRGQGDGVRYRRRNRSADRAGVEEADRQRKSRSSRDDRRGRSVGAGTGEPRTEPRASQNLGGDRTLRSGWRLRNR